jgi:1-acyl-sn-glycerol-3-phosphate acyltransferase
LAGIATATADNGQTPAQTKSDAVRLNARAMLRIAGLVLLFVVVAPLHIAAKALLGRTLWPSRFLRAAAWIIGVRTTVIGRRPSAHTLLVANHTSWLDILIIGGVLRSAFVSKEELGHPFIHWLADQNATVYVRRSDRKGARDQAAAVATALERDKPVTIFPEGTTGPGTHLLPFRSTLLEAASLAAKDVCVRPVAVDYGAARAEVGWFDEAGGDNVKRLLGRRGTLPVLVQVLNPLDRSLDRKGLTQAARDAIAARLGLTSPAHSPIDGGE